MKYILFFLLPITSVGQGLVVNNCKLLLKGSVNVVLYNADLVNNGNISADNGTVWIAGNQTSAIKGNNATSFSKLIISKSPGVFASLQNDVVVTDTITMNSGMLQLNNRTLNLGSTGIILNERNASYITGGNGGRVVVTKYVKTATNAFNPGRIGLEFTSSMPLGNLVIERTHTPTFNNINRSFFIYGANSDVNASIKFYYVDDELGGADESTLVMWKASDISSSFIIAGNDGSDATQNWVMKNGVDNISRFTLTGESISFMKAYPNPTNDKFTVAFYSKVKRNISVHLSTQAGRLLFKKTVHAEVGLNQFALNLGGYTAGVYLVWDNTGAIKLRIVKL